MAAKAGKAKTVGYRLLAIAFLAAYFGSATCFLYGHLLGLGSSSALGYFFTWDMFPNYPSFSARRLALAQTEDGEFRKILPNSAIRFRKGGTGELTRFDLPRNDDALRKAVDEIILKSPEAGSERIVYVYLIEKYWPVRFNLPEDLYQSAYGEENPHRRAFRIIDEGFVNESNEIQWSSQM